MDASRCMPIFYGEHRVERTPAAAGELDVHATAIAKRQAARCRLIH